MGYSTEFTGELYFKEDLTVKQLTFIEKMCGEDCRDHKDWAAGDLTHMDLELTEDYSGLRWNGSEKTYDLVEKINLIIRRVREQWPDFAGLSTGKMVAHGEDADDNWVIICNDDGTVQRDELILTGAVVQCPSCNHKFEPGDQ